MKKLLLALLLLLSPSLARAQSNSQFINILLGPTGRPLAGAVVTFCSNTTELAIPCTTTINLFNSSGTPISNPQLSDGRGNINVWAPVGIYLMTVSGPGITPYRVVVNFPGGGGGGGSGTVGPGTINHLAKFTAPTTVGDSVCIDDGVNPMQCVNGLDTVQGGNYDQYVVDTGGVLANRLVCRSDINKVVICPAGTVNGVLGVAQTTQFAGATVRVCWKDCNVIVTNTTVRGDWLIPSASVNGQADSVGATRPTNGTANFLAESSATAGNSVRTPLISLDTLGGVSSGSGTINPCLQYGSAYYLNPGTSNVLGCITPPTVNTDYVIRYHVTGGIAVAPTADPQGKFTTTVSGTTDTIGYADRVGCKKYTSNSAVAVTLPQAGPTPFNSNFVFCAYVAGNGAVTITPTVSTLTTFNGSTTTTGPITLTKGQWITIHSPDNSSWDALAPGAGGITSAYNLIKSNGTPVTQRTTVNLIAAGTAGVNCVDNPGSSQTDCTFASPNGPPAPYLNGNGNFTYTAQNSDNMSTLVFTGAGAVAVTLPTAGGITIAPQVSQHTFTTTACTACLSGSFALLASHMNYVFIVYGNPVSVNSITDTAGNTYTRVAPDRTDPTGNATAWRAMNTIANPANVLTINFSGITGNVFILQSEYDVAATDNQGSADGINAQVNIPVSFPNELAVGSYADAGGGCPSGWTFRQSLSLGQFVTCDRILNSVGSSLFFPPGVTTSAAFQSDYGITGLASFQNGWYTTYVNNTPTASPVTVTTTVPQLINGRTKLVIMPNEACKIISDGANWFSQCDFIQNAQTDGVVGGSVTIAAPPQTAGNTSIGAATLMTTPSSPVSTYKMAGYAEVTVAGTSCAGNTTVILNAIYTSPAAGGTTTLPLGTFTIVTNGTVGTSNFSYPAAYFRAKGSTTIQFSTTYTAGGSCSPAPTVQVTPVLQVN